MNGLALCAGAGGLELGIGLALGDAYRTVAYVEHEATAAAVLVARMQEGSLDAAPLWDDLKTFDGRPWHGLVDLVSGGYPCQPFSVAGKQRGAADPRHLWPEVYRIVCEVEPAWCFFENVGGHLRLGYHDVVRPDLERAGYRVAEGLFTAAEVGASHQRERLFIMAHRDAGGWRAAERGRGQRAIAGSATGRRDADERDTGMEHAERPRRAKAGKRRDIDAGAEPQARDGELADAGHAERPGRDDTAAGERGSGQPPRAEPAPRSEPVADAEVTGRREHEQGARTQRRTAAGRAGAGVDDADEPRPQGWDTNGRGSDERAAWPTSSALGLFPPGPGDADAWRAILAERPDLAPAVESGVRGLANGLAGGMALTRSQQLRITGNGVVPLAAAYAWRTLRDRIEGLDQGSI